MSDLKKMKQAAAESAAELPQNGMVVGLGTGSTAALLIDALGVRVRAGLRMTAIPTSEATAKQARELGISLSTLEEYPRVDLTIDGADEVERGTLDLVKGLGGALLREKIVASASARLAIIVDESKLVERLGSRGPVPVEVIPFGWSATAAKLQALGAEPKLRVKDSGEPFVTDGGHYIVDCAIHSNAQALAREIDGIVGVVEHGLFLGLTTEVYVGEASGSVRVLRR